MAPAEQSLRGALHLVRRRWLTVVALSVAWRAALAAAVVITGLIAAGRLLHPAGSLLLALCGAAIVCVAMCAVWIAWPFRTRPDDRRVARFIEERCPEFEDEIVAAVDVASRAPASSFAPLVVERAAVRLQQLDAARVIDAATVRSGFIRVGAAVAVLGLACVIATPLVQRAATEARVRFLPWTFRIDVRPGNVRLPAGTPLTITARLDASGRFLAGVVPELQLESLGQLRSVPMTETAQGYEWRIDGIDRAFAYRVRAGRAVSQRYVVTALRAPRVEAIDLHYEYPGFTSLAPRDEADGGDIYAPAGTRVRLRVRADKPIANAHVATGSAGTALPIARVDARTFESTLTLAHDGSYRATVLDADGLRGESVEYFIRLVDDRPPDIHIVRPAGDQQITPLEEVTIEARADDDYGIASMDMVFAIAGGPQHVVPFQTFAGTSTARIGSRLIAAEELGVKPGDVISYYARARDVPHAKASTLAHSEIYFLEVKPFTEEYSLAESQAMAAATGTELEGLIAAQKEVISATWNLQRRAAAGMSRDDVRAVATAQAEVKARTDRAAGAHPVRRGFGGMFFQVDSERAQPGGGSGNVAEAAAAMGRALEQLNAGATQAAMPQEMAALNALLKAEAEIRQRQITEQRSGASTFGNGRQGQDLSTLFDRELKRQQRTNYETGSRAEDPAPDEQSAVDRIRDLARRQEDLARRQQGLDTLAQDERRRELERLTREQEELRRQLEQAAARQQQRGAESRASRGNGAPTDAGDLMREAMEQMRRAAADLQRNDPGSAAGRAAKAAEQLRQAESRMQPNTGQDRAGNAETRKLADALDALRQQRDRLTALERRLADLERARKDGQPQSGKPAPRGGRSQEQSASGTPPGQAPQRGNERPGDEIERAREDYARELQRARELVGTLPQGGRDTSRAAATPEQHEWSWGAPGTEAWKQDFSKWESLGKDIGRALERSEASVAGRLSKSLARDRLRAGGSDRVPEAYAERVRRYYESLASGKGPVR